MKFIYIFISLIISNSANLRANNFGYFNESKSTLILQEGKVKKEISISDSLILSDVESNNGKILIGAIIKNSQNKKNVYIVDKDSCKLKYLSSCYTYWKPFSLKNKYEIIVVTDTDKREKLFSVTNNGMKALVDISSEWPVVSPNGKLLYFYSVDKYYIYWLFRV